jgi:hypothetical protein
MKKLLTPVCMFLFFAASAQLTKDDVAVIQEIYGKEKKDLVQEYMTFNDSASAKSFWKIYDSYEADRKKLAQDYISILQDYANNFENLDDKKADELITKTYSNNIAFESLFMNYYKKLKPAVGALKASQFIQLEAYFRSAIKTAILDEIPFIGEIDKERKPLEN